MSEFTYDRCEAPVHSFKSLWQGDFERMTGTRALALWTEPISHHLRRLYVPPPRKSRTIRRHHRVAPLHGLRTHAASVSQVVADSLEVRFRKQADKWRNETGHLSSPSQMIMHPSYQAILGMALDNKQEIVRLMLHDLQENRTPWFWALSYLTQDNPIQRSEVGKLDKMIKAWVDWGKARDMF